ncbi:LysR family transcriptional regulator [Arthrobacter sp. SDTb3-6]|uniref:LysR family transcriptional regulator n=1 Tax=Arthrobacter sp. SDTb3-6 TaxID=2713571 RepID=UPI00159D1B88|nr:LysR family transcriptional regulator [Arthrobacter sp. SDTb3-6]NVM98088.1 LysR family transcriptional regulator [Arthrobacter sp. SDTb3-6]
MNLRRLEYFLAVVEEGSVSLAARRLHMTQPPLSQAIQALEREVGTELLQRLPRGVEPTAAGRLLAEQGRDLLRWSERVGESVQRIGQGLGGRLRIACVPSISWSLLPPLLKRFRVEAPEVEVLLSDPQPLRVLNLVADGGADVGFIAPTDTASVAAAYPSLVVEPLAEMPLGLVTPLDREQAGGPVDAAAFAQDAWIIPEAVPGFPGLAELADELWRREGFRPARVQYVSTLQTTLPLVAAGIGVGLMPMDLVGPFTPGVRIAEVAGGVAPLRPALIRSAQMRPSPALERFLGVVSAAFGATGPEAV